MERRQQLGKDTKSATAQHIEDLIMGREEEMQVGNFTTIPTHHVLRKIISEQIKKETLHTDYVRELQLLKESYEKQEDPYIKEITVDPFTTILISQKQIKYISDNTLDMYIDSTGGIIPKIAGQKRSFLYSIVTKPDASLPGFSVADMITTQHHIPKLEYFFNLLKREVTINGGL